MARVGLIGINVTYTTDFHSSLKLLRTKGSISHAFAVCIHTENPNQVGFYPFVLREIFVQYKLQRMKLNSTIKTRQMLIAS